MAEVDQPMVVGLHAELPASLDVNLAARVLARRHLPWLGSPAESAASRRAFRCDLRLPVSAAGHKVELSRAAIVELGAVEHDGSQVAIDITWRSSSLAPLFPVFSGRMTIGPDRIRLDGWYAPPGGRLGLAVDRAILGFAARGTADWFLSHVAEALQHIAERKTRTVAVGRAADGKPG